MLFIDVYIVTNHTWEGNMRYVIFDCDMLWNALVKQIALINMLDMV